MLDHMFHETIDSILFNIYPYNLANYFSYTKYSINLSWLDA